MSPSRQRKSRAAQVGQRGAPGTPLVPIISMVHEQPTAGGKASCMWHSSSWWCFCQVGGQAGFSAGSSPGPSSVARGARERGAPGSLWGHQSAAGGQGGLVPGQQHPHNHPLARVHSSKRAGKWRHGQSRAPGVEAAGWGPASFLPRARPPPPPSPAWPPAQAGSIPRAVFTSYIQNI